MSTEKGVDVEAASKDLSADGATPDCDVQNRCYSRRMLMKLSENANHDFVPKERLEEIGLYCSWSLGSVTTENDVVSPAEEVSSPDNGLTESSAGTQETAINTVSTESSAGTQENTVNTESKKIQPSSKEAGEATEFGLLIADISEEMVQEIWHKLRKDDLFFEWCLQTLVGDLKPRIRCTSCGLSGHLIDACPELQLPKVVPIRPMDKKQKDLVDVLLRTVYRRLCMNADYERLLRDFCSQLEVCLMNGYRNDCRLSLFGSAGNGFGLIGSDADICLRFAAESISEVNFRSLFRSKTVEVQEVDPCEVITDVAEVVKQMPGIAGVTPITNAKVPIVKVQCGRMFDRLEAE
ncbi:unnamed protein product [Anisakis simplex]|uniref:CCHC-type domain-containing protein n=1 Tax=Anisakis simplex TaxID=6269 RepID=A0A0M3J4G6_ANISI|nr:unnamed protein product [Anisakis simplex]